MKKKCTTLLAKTAALETLPISILLSHHGVKSARSNGLWERPMTTQTIGRRKNERIREAWIRFLKAREMALEEVIKKYGNSSSFLSHVIQDLGENEV